MDMEASLPLPSSLLTPAITTTTRRVTYNP